ncbi:MAG: hypothetical protein JO304_09165 [Solirubrobacterales bacterium]|nr:hypothetical protein [Solirubrobacterales bacterium]
MPRIFRSSSVVCAVAILALVPVAFASAARRASRYAGTGTDYLNNAPKWAPEAHASITFQTSSDGNIRKFHGTYACYCNCSAGLYVTAASIHVNPNGSFAYRFSVAQKHGRDYVAISGRFLDKRSRATVAYLVDFLGTGQHVADPYATSDPRALGCASWVKGSVSAR